MPWLEFSSNEFTDRSGVIRPIAICSLLGRSQFFERLDEIRLRLAQANPTESWQEFYDRDSRLRFLVERCLRLNGIDPDWVTLDMVESLLFSRLGEDGEARDGWLVELNRPKPARTATPAQPMTLPQLLATIASHTSSLEEALRLAGEAPADLLLETLEARSEQLRMADPKAQREAKLAKLKANFDELMSLPVGEQVNG